jgi:hypothetical protein
MGAGAECNGALGFVLVNCNGPNWESYCPFGCQGAKANCTLLKFLFCHIC